MQFGGYQKKMVPNRKRFAHLYMLMSIHIVFSWWLKFDKKFSVKLTELITEFCVLSTNFSPHRFRGFFSFASPTKLHLQDLLKNLVFPSGWMRLVYFYSLWRFSVLFGFKRVKELEFILLWNIHSWATRER